MESANKKYWIVRIFILVQVITSLSAANLSTSNDTTTTDPCDNFYNYACKSHTDSNTKSLVEQAQERVIDNLKHLVQNPDNEIDVLPIKLWKTFYNSCIDTESVNSRGIEPIKTVLNIFGGWPITAGSSNHENLKNWQDILSFYGKIDVFPLYEIKAHDAIFHGKTKILIRQPVTAFFENVENDTKVGRNKYVNFIKNIIEIIATSNESTAPEQVLEAQANQIASFETELSKILSSKHSAKIYQPKVLKDFQNDTNQYTENSNITMDWVSIINNLYSESTKLITDEDEVDVSTPDYYPKLVQLLQNTSTDTILNYIHWRFVLQYLPYTSNEIRHLYFEQKNILENPAKETSRFYLCAFEPIFDSIISYQYAKNYINSEIEDSVQEILNNIKDAVIEIIKGSTFLKEKEKESAERKVLSMSFGFGISETLKNISTILEFYDNTLTIGDSYFENILALRRFSKIKELERIKKDNFVDTTYKSWMRLSNFDRLGSIYDDFGNKVYIKAENLASPLFNPNFSEVKKYSLLGFTIARNIMSAFEGSDSIDSYIAGIFKKLYSAETIEKYWDKMNCFITQFTDFSSYVSEAYDKEFDAEPAVHNIGDTAAVKIAVKAYRIKIQTQDVTSTTDDQQFFKLFAGLLCRPELKEFTEEWMVHLTKPQYRIMGSVPNVEEFAQAFACPKGSRMNPENKCTFWN